MHLGDITKRDIANEIRDIKNLPSISRGRMEDQWRPTTLQYLAELWAEQERGAARRPWHIPFWLETHVDDGRVEEPGEPHI